MTDYYRADTGEPVPSDVSETFDSLEQWDCLNPENVRVHTSVIGELYEGSVEGKQQYVDSFGHATDTDRYDDCEMLNNDELPPSLCGPYSYNDNAEVVHHDHYAEHVTKVIVVTGRHERQILNSRSGVVWWSRRPDVQDGSRLSRTTLEVAGALSDANNELSTPDDFGQALGGWHSSIEPSKQSELINALAKGDIPKPELDNTDPFPYVIKYGDTNNVCSQPVSIYCYDDVAHWFKDVLDGQKAKPAYAGIN